MWRRHGCAARSHPDKLLKNDRWEKLKDIFQEALERPSDEREQFLGEACNGDDEMRDEVRQLLASFDQDEAFMESPAIGEVAETIVGRREILTKGQQVGRYEVIEKIGAGGMGDVFLARDTQLERLAALKVLPELHAADAARVSRFIREAKAASALNHPNIITIYEILNFESSHLIATEFIEGETLRSRQRRAPLSLPEVIDVASQVSAALSAAHSAGIVHRDIKPENIMLRKDGLVKVLDFGLAKLTERADEDVKATAPTRTVATDPGIVMGTVSYMSPEQVRGLPDIDRRADIWSLGVVMYEAVMGDPPFSGGTTSDVIASILKSDPRRLSDECPAEFQRIVNKTLRKERRDRYKTSEDLTFDLRNFGRELETSWPDLQMSARPVTVSADMPSRLTQNLKIQRFSYLHLLAIIIAFGGLFGGAWWFFGGGGQAATSDVLSLKSDDIVSWSSSSGEQTSTGTFSPDGKMIAFVSSKSGNRDIWIKQVGSGEAIQITKDKYSNQNPIWSPDGSEIAYFSNRGDQYGIWRIPAFGGSATLIAPVKDGGTELHSWSPKNLIYFNSPQDVNLFTLDAGTGKSAKITDLDQSTEISISRNEELIAYVLPEGEEKGIWVRSRNDGKARQVTKDGADVAKVTWHPDNRRIFYNARLEGHFQIFVTDIDGSAPKQLSFSDKDNFVMDVAADGGKILYGWAKEESDVWGVDLGSSKEFTVAADIDGELWANAAFAGDTIVYQSVKGLGPGDRIFKGSIFTRKVNSDEQPTQLAQNAFLPVWSPDGKQVAFMQFENDEYQIKAVNASGGIPTQLTASGAISSGYSIMPYNHREETDYSWSPDSRRIAYSSARGGQENIWLTNADGSGEIQITENNDKELSVGCPIWSSDGNRIAYSTRPRQRGPDDKFTYSFMLADTETRQSKLIFQADYFVRLLGWSQDERSLILASGAGDGRIAVPPEVTLFQISLETGQRRPIAVLKASYIFNIDLSADRKEIAFAANQDGKDNLWTMPATGGQAQKITSNSDPRLYFSKLAWAADGKRIYFGKQMRYNLISMLNDYK